jgi:putative MATE family efflux protein
MVYLRSLSSRFGPLSFYRHAIAIALPVMLQQLIMSMVSLVDNFMVAGLGDVSMAAVNVTNHITFVFFVFINTICQAGGIYIAQFNGANDREGMKYAFRFKVIFAVAMAAFFFFVCRLFPHTIISMMTMNNAAQKEIAAVGSSYLKIISFATFPAAISMTIATSYREIARPKIPLLISIAAAIINTIGNWILIYGNLGAPRLEVEGAAYATLIARFFEFAAFIGYAAYSKAPFFTVHLFTIKKLLIIEILSRSAMIFISEFSWISTETLMIAMYNQRGGAEVVAGMAAGWTIANIFFTLFGGIWTVSYVLVGGSLGAGKLDEARNRAKWLTSGSLFAGTIVAIPGALLSIALVPLVFSNLSAAAQGNCLRLVFVILAYLPVWCLLNLQFAVSRAGGDTAMGMWVDVLVNTFIFTPAIIILALATSLSPVPMYAILKLTDVIKIFIARRLLRKEKWIKNLTAANQQ